MRYVTKNDWHKFEQMFPEANAYLIHCDLKGELNVLRNRSVLNDWEKTRLAELETLFNEPYRLAMTISGTRDRWAQ